MPRREHLAPAVRAAVDAVLREPARGRAVAFDADGTLWRGDIGEELLRYLACEGRLPALRGRRGIYEEYERRVAVDPAGAYAWSVEVMAGIPARELEALCVELFQRRFEGRLFAYARPLVAELCAHGLEVWIVSASPLWPVQAGARALGVDEDRVIAVRCGLDEAGCLTGEVETPVPCGEGKVHHLRARGIRPALAFGNGELDLPMLAWAERAVVLAPPDADNALTRAAAERNWPIQRC
ncbi:MAG: HAD-IB family phosphatase [Myxococcaceae bacterium]|nr:HAD-IB family phosphatase [Myxococcaceae bacterium]